MSRYTLQSSVIKSFADKRTEALFRERVAWGVPPDLVHRATNKLDLLDGAKRLDDLRIPRGNRLHALRGDREGQHAIAVNNQWRICFRFVHGNAFEVEFCDYH